MSSGPVRSVRPVWHIFDGEGEVVGRLATHISRLLMGKHKPFYSPHADMGDYVVVVNARKLVLTGKKYEEKLYRWHTGYPGGLKSATPKFISEQKNRPEEILERAVSGMLPKNKLRKRRIARLKVFAEEEHPLWENFTSQQVEEFMNREKAPELLRDLRKGNQLFPIVEQLASDEEAAEFMQAVESKEFKELSEEEALAEILRDIEFEKSWKSKKRW